MITIISTILYWCRLIPVHRHPPTEGYKLLWFSNTHWKGATTPRSCLPTPTARELLPPEHIYQLPLEGSFEFLIEGSNAQHFRGPCFIIFILDPLVSINHQNM